MDHSFNDRVDKVFGSISASSPSSAPWSITDAQVERRGWDRDKADNRDDDDETLVSSSFDNLFNRQRNRRKSLDDLSDDDDDGDVGGDDGVQTENDGDEWDIRSSIGLDPTLDNEEEEDAYDKMAEGREDKDSGDRVYMKDVTDHGPYLNCHNVLPSCAHDVKKDPRANLDAAKTRLKEDDEPMLNAEEAACMTTGTYGMRIKSILKRKINDDGDDAVKPPKRVRFDPTCKNDGEESRRTGIQVQPSGSAPDYILNPSKYTRYDFDDAKEGSNTEAYLDFVEQLYKSKQGGGGGGEKSSAGDVPCSSIVFIPRKKRGEAEAETVKQPSTKGIGIGVAAVEVQQAEEGGDVSQEMQEEEESHACNFTSKKAATGRRYRSRMEEDDSPF